MTVEENLKRLDIDEIHDIHAVKKAYAKQVKLYHPEEDPIAFQELQQAYHEAIRYARAQQQQSVLVQESIPAREETAGEEAFTKIEKKSFLQAAQTTETQEEDTAGNHEQLPQAIAEAVRMHDHHQLQELLQVCEKRMLLQEDIFLKALSRELRKSDNEIPFTIRQQLQQAFHLKTSELRPVQEELLDSIQKGIPVFQSYRFSCKRDQEYLLQTWEELCSQSQEDTEAWLEFLNQRNWEDDDPDAQMAEKIVEFEMRKMYAHSSAVAGKIYSFLHIREHLLEDEKQTYARLKLLLSKDDSFSEQDFISWKREIYGQVHQFAAISSRNRPPEEWKKWLKKQNMNPEDLELLVHLGRQAKNYHYVKATQKLLFSYFKLKDNLLPVQQEFKEAIQAQPQAYMKKRRTLTLLLLIMLLLTFLIPSFMNYSRQQRVKKEQEQEELREIQKKAMEELEKKKQEQLEKMLEGAAKAEMEEKE